MYDERIFFHKLVRKGSRVIFSYFACHESVNTNDPEDVSLSLKYLITTNSVYEAFSFQELIDGTLHEITDNHIKLFLLKKCKIHLLDILNSDDSQYTNIRDIEDHIIKSFNDYIEQHFSEDINYIRKVFV
jgi:hypothetical protein